MVTIIQIVLAALIGTSVMTLFSYSLAYILDRQFKEPRLLNKLLDRSKFGEGKHISPVFGWFIHYGIGFLFAVAYHYIWKFTFVEPAVLSGSILGFCSGLIGIAGWSLLIKMHSDPPSIDFSKYYIHLMVAHVIFGICATYGYMIVV